MLRLVILLVQMVLKKVGIKANVASSSGMNKNSEVVDLTGSKIVTFNPFKALNMVENVDVAGSDDPLSTSINKTDVNGCSNIDNVNVGKTRKLI